MKESLKQKNNEKTDEKVQGREEEVKEIGEQMQASYKFIPPGTHKWRQRGPYLTCMSCEIQHALYIGMEKMMIGENADTTPILVGRRSKI